MGELMSRQVKIHFLFVILIGSFILSTSCESKIEKERKNKLREIEQKMRQEEKRIKPIVMALINRYSPILFPPKNLGQEKIFTYSLQRILITKDEKPILFFGVLNDVTKTGEDFFVHFSSNLSAKRRIRFHLKCKYEDVKSLIENPPKYGTNFFVVSKIKNVEKIVNYTVEGLKGSEGVELEIQSPDVFGANGKLVEMVEAGGGWVILRIFEQISGREGNNH